MSNVKTNSDRLRDDRNRELIRRMNNGETLTTFSSASSWFPPRPIIEKDSKALAQLYGGDRMTVEQQVETTEELRSSSKETSSKSSKSKVSKLQLI